MTETGLRPETARITPLADIDAEHSLAIVVEETS